MDFFTLANFFAISTFAAIEEMASAKRKSDIKFWAAAQGGTPPKDYNRALH